MTENASINVKQAVEIAAKHLQSLLPTAENPRLEEAEISEDDRFWLITLGFYDPNEPKSGAEWALISGPRRIYKIFKIDRATGEVRAMKIRETAHVS